MIKLWPKYENWSKLGKQNRVYRYTPNVYRYTLAENDQKPKCTGTCSKCTGTLTEKCPKCVFSPIFHAPSSMDHSYTSYTHQNHSNIILIWVMTHTQTKHQDLLGFVLKPNSISFHFTRNPTTKGGFHTYFVPCGFYQP